MYAAAALRHQVNTRMFSDEQLDSMTDVLMQIFCARHKKVRLRAMCYSGTSVIRNAGFFLN